MQSGGFGLPACACVCTRIAVTAATCHLFHFKAAGVTQVLWWRGQERCWVPRGAGSLPAREEAADGCWQTGGRSFLPQQGRQRAHPKIGGRYGWVGKSEGARWALMSFSECRGRLVREGQ